MRFLFWSSLAIILYTYAGYPLAIAVLARIWPRPWERGPIDSIGQHPFESSVSVVMAVHNGAAVLPDKIKHLLALDPALIREIIIVSDGSTDETAFILKSLSHPRLRAIVLEEHGGKATALNHGIAAATGDILLFIDIRPRIEPGAIASLLSNFVDPSVGCVAGELQLYTRDHSEIASAISGLYWRYEQWIRTSEAAWDSPVGVYGGFYAIRRALAAPSPAGLILDDMFQPLAIIRQGYRSVLDRRALVTDTWPTQAGGEFQRKVRTLAGNFQLVALAPWVLSLRNRVLFQLVSHKLLRLAVPYCFAALLFSSAILGVHSMYWGAIAFLQVAFWLMALMGLRLRIPLLHRLSPPASALLVLNHAAVVGLYTFLFTSGPLWKIWSATAPPAESLFQFPAKQNP